jgi:predicted dehydrogenase
MMIRFAAVGLNHGHVYGQTSLLLQAGAELAAFYAEEDDLAGGYGQAFPGAKRSQTLAEILEDPSIHLITSAAIPCERASIGILAMQHGKDFLSDKPAFTTLEQLAEARRVQTATSRIYSVLYGERLESAASVHAGELVRQGAIGQVIQTLGVGPHRLNLPSRPDWFFRKVQYGGILVDIAAHQVDQFLFYTGATAADIVAAQVGNFHHPLYPELEDFGDLVLTSKHATGYHRVDWFTPDGLPTWGDGRLTILGSEGYIELRKRIDLAGRPGAEHLFLVNQDGVQYIPCEGMVCPFGAQLLADIRDRSETAMPQAHAFMVAELCLRAEAGARRIQ